MLLRFRNPFRNILLIVYILGLVSLCSGLLLDLFGEKDRHGISIRVEVSDSECSNLPISWSSKAASINTLGSCVQLYDQPFCKGALAIVQPFHTIHQMDLSLVNFGNRVQSASACGPKIKSGRFVIQNAADATILTVSSRYGGFARAFTVNASNVIPKAQQWEVAELPNSEYSLRPREYEDNFPVTYDEDSLRKGQVKKKLWTLVSVGRGRYIIKTKADEQCLYKTEENKVEEHDCRIWSPNQEWILKEVFGNSNKDKKKNPGQVGPGLNFNILSKVASYPTPRKPIPQYAPIVMNASDLVTLRPKITPRPYVVRKKIRRGPRPQSKPLEQLLSHIRPPGLKDRPALSDKLSNNNKFLLQKQHQLYNIKEFVPTDDRIEAYAYYHQVLVTKKKKEQELKAKWEHVLKQKNPKELVQILHAVRAHKAGLPPPMFPPKNGEENKDEKNKKKKKGGDDESNESNEEDDEEKKKDDSEERDESKEHDDEDEDGKEKNKKKKQKENDKDKEHGSEEDKNNDEKEEEKEKDEEQEDKSDESNEDDEEGSKKGDKKKRPGPPPGAPLNPVIPHPPEHDGPPFNPYELNYSNFDHTNNSHLFVVQNEGTHPSSNGLLSSMFSRVKSGIGSFVPSVPFMSQKKTKQNLPAITEGYQTTTTHRPVKYKLYPNLLRPGQGLGRPFKGKHRSDMTTIPTTTTTTTKKPSMLLGFLG